MHEKNVWLTRVCNVTRCFGVCCKTNFAHSLVCEKGIAVTLNWICLYGGFALLY